VGTVPSPETESCGGGVRDSPRTRAGNERREGELGEGARRKKGEREREATAVAPCNSINKRPGVICTSLRGVSIRAIRRKQAPRESVNRLAGGERQIPRGRSGRKEGEGTVGGGVGVVKFSGLYFPRSAGETPPEFHPYHFLPTMPPPPPPPLPLTQKGRLTRKLAPSFTPGVKVKSAR